MRLRLSLLGCFRFVLYVAHTIQYQTVQIHTDYGAPLLLVYNYA